MHGGFQRTRFLILFFALLGFTGCGDSCSNTIKAEGVSPDGKYVATAFIRDCGATTDFSPHVHLRPVGERMARTGNVFIGDIRTRSASSGCQRPIL